MPNFNFLHDCDDSALSFTSSTATGSNAASSALKSLSSHQTPLPFAPAVEKVATSTPADTAGGLTAPDDTIRDPTTAEKPTQVKDAVAPADPEELRS